MLDFFLIISSGNGTANGKKAINWTVFQAHHWHPGELMFDLKTNSVTHLC